MNLVIVGTGLAGYMLAKEWRKRDSHSSLTLVTASHGDFYSKPLLSTALTQGKTAQQLAMNSAADMAGQLQARVITQTPVTGIALGSQQLQLAQETLAYDALVLALGAKPLSLRLQGDAADALLSVNNLEEYAAWRDRLHPGQSRIAIIGTGLVGCEFANDLLNAGCQVSLVSMESAPLARLVPASVGQALQQAFAARGAHWHFGTSAAALWHDKNGYRLELTNGTVVHADLVLSAVGLQPNVDLARAAGLAVRRGICVNRHLQTSDPHVYALGDCAEVEGQVLQYVAPLLQCAKTLAQHLVAPAPPVEYPPMPVVIKTPLCPIVTLPPAPQSVGEWQCSGEGSNQRAYYVDAQQQLQGFALSGECVRERFELVKRMPPVFA